MVSNVVSKAFIEELDHTQVNVQFSNKGISGYPYFNPLTGNIDIEPIKQQEIKNTDGCVVMVTAHEYFPFTVTINEKFLHKQDDIFYRNREYSKYLSDVTTDVITEIDTNINLRVGKWDILDYFSLIKLKLKNIRSGYYEIKNNCIETNCRQLYKNPHAKITTNDHDLLNIPGSAEWVDLVLTDYWRIQMSLIDRVLDYIDEREKIIEKTEDYVKTMLEIPNINRSITWEASDTDLLELIVAMVESGSLQNSTKSLTRKEAIEFFSEVFGLEIKDAESKLSRATERKKDLSPFLTKLKTNFERYVQKKDNRLENIRN